MSEETPTQSWVPIVVTFEMSRTGFSAPAPDMMIDGSTVSGSGSGNPVVPVVSAARISAAAAENLTSRTASTSSGLMLTQAGLSAAAQVRQPVETALPGGVQVARVKVPGLPAGFRYHDLRHYLASLLIASGADVKTVQARLRHASAKTTLDTYGHLWPDRDESARAAVEAVFAARADSLRTAAGQR